MGKAAIRSIMQRFPVDPYLLLLLSMVALGLVLPARGSSQHLVNGLAYAPFRASSSFTGRAWHRRRSGLERNRILVLDQVDG